MSKATLAHIVVLKRVRTTGSLVGLMIGRR